MAYQGRAYAINMPSTAMAASATLPFATVIGTAAVRTRVYGLLFGSPSTPANNACEMQFQRCTTAGTPGSSLTPQALDPGDPAAVTTSGLATFSAGPTLTASAFLQTFPLNQQASLIWQAPPGGELVVPATASNGLALMTQVLTSAFNGAGTIYFAE